jgi:hypothetical protein
MMYSLLVSCGRLPLENTEGAEVQHDNSCSSDDSGAGSILEACCLCSVDKFAGGKGRVVLLEENESGINVVHVARLRFGAGSLFPCCSHRRHLARCVHVLEVVAVAHTIHVPTCGWGWVGACVCIRRTDASVNKRS